MQRLENGFFLVLLFLASAALIWISAPLFGAILWGLIAAILFAPVNRRLLKLLPGHRNSAALLTLLLIIAVVVVPAAILGTLLLQEAAGIYDKVRSGQIDFAGMFQHIQALIPNWAEQTLRRFGLFNPEELRERLAAGLTGSFQFVAAQALSIGQSTLGFFMTTGVGLYLAFFLLRDGPKIAKLIDNAVPLPAATRHALAEKTIAVTRATINGSLVVALVQGLIGGIIFSLLGIPGALLWGVCMAFFSLLPAIGTGLIWVPVAIYLLASGALWQGLTLVFCGIFVIGMVDNVLRPILVGRDTRIPDYVVLISTLGGLEIFGFNGIVIGPVIAAVFLAVWEIFADSRIAAAARSGGA